MNGTQGTKVSAEVHPIATAHDGREGVRPGGTRLRHMLWVCLLLACCGTSWFAYQYILVPHPTSFAPDWQGARWVRASDSTTPVAYFRYATSMNALPDGAFVTIAASQIFRLYVNETFIGSNTLDFAQGDFPRAYMYDVVSSLRLGKNVLSVRVTNVDGKPPALRLSFGMAHGHMLSFRGTGNVWQGTSESSKAQLRFSDTLRDWTKRDFDTSTWPPVTSIVYQSAEPMLGVNPLIYEQPVPTQWMSAGSGHEAYFVRQVTLPIWTNGTWLRLAATGTARIFINGHLFMIWNGQAPVPQQSLASYLSSDANIVHYRTGLVLGVYDISSYVHPGVNTIAVHVSAPGITATRAGLGNLNAAMAFDLLSTDVQQHTVWLASSTEWHASYLPVSNWAEGGTALTWGEPLAVGRPGVAQSFYLSDTSNPRSQQYIPFLLAFTVIAGSVVGVVLLWLLMALFILRSCVHSQQEALELSSIAFFPALACEVVLVALAREPQMPHPFPYTWPWAVLLLCLVAASCLLLQQNARRVSLARIDAELFTIPVHEAITEQGEAVRPRRGGGGWDEGRGPLRSPLDEGKWEKDASSSTKGDRKGPLPSTSATPAPTIMGWLRAYWGLLCILLLAIPLICYNLSYEPYWQDELTSYYAAQGILAHGLPIMPSGFLYTKGELYSYMLALFMAIFGNQYGVPRLVSVLEYLVSLPVLYMIGTYFFGRRVALLATTMLALSPMALVWGRQVRMYEQAQLLTMLLVYLFYRALRERERVSLVYLAFGVLLLTYLSHEETFILFPAIALSIIVMKGNEYLQWRFGQTGATEPKPQWRILRHWLLAAILSASGIAMQLLIARYSHPPVLGLDQSQRPLIQLTTDNIPYYLYLLFYPAVLGHGQMPLITINSLLATAGCIVALRGTHNRAKYCATFLLLSFLTLMLTFTLATDRYIYPILPLYYLLGAFAMLKGLRTMWGFARRCIASQYPLARGRAVPEGYLARTPHIIARVTLGLLCGCVLITPILPISSYNLFVSQSAGFAYHKHYPDYDGVGQYIQQHWRKGDVVVAVSPAISVLYYVGHVDYFFSINRALYLFERNGHIIDTPTGSVALLNQEDFQAVVTAHARVWIVSDNGLYQQEAMKDNRFVFPPDFHIVYEGYGSAIYFQGS